MSRDRDVRNAIRDTLMATGAFADVLMGRPLDDYATSAVGGETCHVEPHSDQERPLWDVGPQSAVEVNVRLRLTLTSRHDDPRARDEAVERLLNVAAAALTGQSLGGLTLPAFTSIESSRWLAPKHPERQIEAILRYRYLVESLAFDTTE